MLNGASGRRRPQSMVLMIAAVLCAAGIVIYLQYRERVTLDRQTRVILQKYSEEAASSVAEDIRRTFDGPVFETLSAVNHPLLRAGRFDLVAQEYDEGLAKFPQVERFFLWHELIDPLAPGEVLFYGRQHPDTDGAPDRPAKRRRTADREISDTLQGVPPAFGSGLKDFSRERPFGRQIYEQIERVAKSQWIYAAVEQEVGSSRYDVFIRLFWTDASRDRFFAVLGFAVDLGTLRRELFAELAQRRFDTLLRTGEDGPRLELRILDEAGALVYGSAEPLPSIVGKADLSVQFYPAGDIGSRMAAEIRPRLWQIIVSPVATELPADLAPLGERGYWLSGASVLLMLVALLFAIRTNRHALELSRMQADFVSHVSHQLKTPLSLLSAASQTIDLERVRSPEKLGQYLSIVKTETARLTALVDRVLEFSRVDGRRRTYEFEPVVLSPLVRETVEAFQRALEDEAVRIRVEESGAPAIVEADPAALEQVMVNLLDNAVKYSRHAKDITVRVGRSASEAVIEVEDHGTGIAPEERGRVFDKFYRGSGAALHRHGFGLGLAIVRDIVRAHRGRVELESVVEQGTTFCVRLPVLKGDGVADDDGLTEEAASHHRAATRASDVTLGSAGRAAGLDGTKG